MTCAGDESHCFADFGGGAKGSVLPVSLPPWSMYAIPGVVTFFRERQ